MPDTPARDVKCWDTIRDTSGTIAGVVSGILVDPPRRVVLYLDGGGRFEVEPDRFFACTPPAPTAVRRTVGKTLAQKSASSEPSNDERQPAASEGADWFNPD